MPWDPATGSNPYIVQTDPFFSRLKAWGNTIWDLWWHNHGLDGVGVPLPGIVPFAMTEGEWGTPPQPPCDVPGLPQNLVATGAKRSVVLSWTAGTPAPIGGYNIYYDQAGKLQFIATVDVTTTTYTDTGLTPGSEYCYVVNAFNDCGGNAAVSASATPLVVCAIPTKK